MNEGVAPDGQALEKLVGQVRGVLAVRVVGDEGGQIEEVHVVAAPGRSAKQMVRDVESILYVRGGVRVDHRKISLVQISEAAIQPPPARVLLRGIQLNQDDGRTQVSVTLGLGGWQVQGIGSGRTTEARPIETLAGYAAVHALNQFVQPRGHVHLEAVTTQPFNGMDICLAHLALTTDEGLETLLGVSIVRDDPLPSAVRAVLDAMNRRLPFFLSVTQRAAP
jgi:hypothetical protein